MIKFNKFLVAFSALLFIFPLIKAQKLYIGIQELTTEQNRIIKSSNLNIAHIFYEMDFLPKGEKSFDENLFRKSIEKYLPNPNQTGIAVIDWESGYASNLRKQNLINSSLFNRSIEELVQAVKFAKKLRPRMEWGFYGLPNSNYWSPNSSWRNYGKRLNILFENCDFIAPSVYFYYKASETNVSAQENYIQKNIGLALTIANQLGKKVYPFVWQRIHEANKKYGLTEVSTTEFRKLVSSILRIRNNSRGVNGIVWWDGQKYFYRNKNKYSMLRKEYSSIESRDVDQYLNKKFSTYLKSIINLFNN